MPHILALLEVIVALIGSPQIAPAQLHAFTVDRPSSRLFVVVHRAGLLSFLGHEHAVIPTEWSMELCLADPIPPGAHASLVIASSSLVIDSDSARALAGMGGGPGDEDRRDIQRRMLDTPYLDAASFPEIRLELRASDPAEGGRIEVEGSIDLHGVTRDVAFPIDVKHAEDGTVTLAGTLRIRQRDFGMSPESRAGLVKVSNDVDLHFALVAVPTDASCGSTR